MPPLEVASDAAAFLSRIRAEWPASGDPARPLVLVGWHCVTNVFVGWEPVPTPASVVPAAAFPEGIVFLDPGAGPGRIPSPRLLLPGVDAAEAEARVRAALPRRLPEGTLQVQIAQAVLHAATPAELLAAVAWDCEGTPDLTGAVYDLALVVRLAGEPG